MQLSKKERKYYLSDYNLLTLDIVKKLDPDDLKKIPDEILNKLLKETEIEITSEIEKEYSFKINLKYQKPINGKTHWVDSPVIRVNYEFSLAEFLGFAHTVPDFISNNGQWFYNRRKTQL